VGYRSRTTFATKSAVSGSRSMLTDQSSNEASSARLNTRRDARRTAAAESNDRAPSSDEPPARCSIVLEITPYHACEVVHHRVRREITCCFFRFDLDLRIRRHQLGRNRNPLADLDPGVDERIVLEV
jgi:hypothetical protein